MENFKEQYEELLNVSLKANASGQTATKCPLHDDKTPSLSINIISGLWVCHAGCGKGNFQQFKNEYTKRNHVDSQLLTFRKPTDTLVQRENPYPLMPETLVTRLNESIDGFHSALNSEARTYWHQRGIKDEVLNKMKIGYKPTSKLYVIPYFDENGNCYFYKCISPNKAAKEFWYPTSITKPRLYNIAAIREAETSGAALVIAEGERDALILIQEGHLCVGCPGADAFKQEYVKLIANVKDVIIAFDHDDAGRKGASRTAGLLGKTARCLNWNDYKENLKDKFDINDLYLEDPKNFKSNLNSLVMKAKQPKQTGFDKEEFYKPFQLEEEEQGKLVLKTQEDLQFILTDFFEGKGIVRAKVQLTGKHGVVYSDTLQLSSGKSRTQFVNKCVTMERDGALDVVQLEKHLLHLERIVKLKGAESQDCVAECEKPSEMTEEEKAEAMNFLLSENLLEEVHDDVTAVGYVGERFNKIMLYLIATSRKLAKPLACVIKAVSSSGKNALVNAVLALIPDEEKKVISRLTENALFYMAEDGLVHKVIHIAEKVGAEEADYSIRSMLSERELVVFVPIKNPLTGMIETKEIRVKGPIAYIETTTQTHINNENETRMFTLTVDESEEQTMRIHEAQRKQHTLEGLRHIEFSESLKRKHQNAQRLLRQVKVIIPYAPELEFPTTRVRTRRDNEKFLSLIETIALLRQYQKELKTEGLSEFIEADLKDYEHAYGLSSAILGQTLDEVSKRSRDLMENIKKMIEEWMRNEDQPVDLADQQQGRTLSNIIFKRADIRKRVSGWSDHAIHECIRELCNYESLRVIQGGQGKTGKYTLATDSEHSLGQEFSKLLTPEQLKRKLDGPIF